MEKTSGLADTSSISGAQLPAGPGDTSRATGGGLATALRISEPSPSRSPLTKCRHCRNPPETNS